MKENEIHSCIRNVNNRQLKMINLTSLQREVIKELRTNGLQTEADFIEDVDTFKQYLKSNYE